METQIERARDIWIDKFKNKWDFQIDAIRMDKNVIMNEVDEEYTTKLNKLKKHKVAKIKTIEEEYNKMVCSLQSDIKKKKETIIKLHEKRLSKFLNSNLNHPTIYDSMCAYILHFKDKFIDYRKPDIFITPNLLEEPEIITRDDIASVHYGLCPNQQSDEKAKINIYVNSNVNVDPHINEYSPPSYETA